MMDFIKLYQPVSARLSVTVSDRRSTSLPNECHHMCSPGSFSAIELAALCIVGQYIYSLLVTWWIVQRNKHVLCISSKIHFINQVERIETLNSDGTDDVGNDCLK